MCVCVRVGSQCLGARGDWCCVGKGVRERNGGSRVFVSCCGVHKDCINIDDSEGACMCVCVASITPVTICSLDPLLLSKVKSITVPEVLIRY